MNGAEKKVVAAVLNRLPFVTWDRLVEIPGGDVDVYGWIPREDGRSDFVLATFPPPIDADVVGFTTSSDRYSEEIGWLIHGEADAEHVPCQRVEHVLGDLVEQKVVL